MTEFLNEKYISIGQVKILETQADKEELRKYEMKISFYFIMKLICCLIDFLLRSFHYKTSLKKKE